LSQEVCSDQRGPSHSLACTTAAKSFGRDFFGEAIHLRQMTFETEDA
jgi:hypothetical protein